MIFLTSLLLVEGEQWPHTNEPFVLGYQRQPSLWLSVTVVATWAHLHYSGSHEHIIHYSRSHEHIIHYSGSYEKNSDLIGN